MGLLDRIQARTVDRSSERRYSADTYINDYLLPATFGYNGVQYGAGLPGLTQTLAGNRATEFTNTLPGYLQALRSCPPAFAAQLVRALVLSQARFVFRNPPWHPSTPRRTFGNRDLQLLEHPWPNATTGELITRMEWHAGLTGNAFVVRRPPTPQSPYGRLRVLRPDWVAILYGSQREPDDPGHALDGELLGYVYQNQGLFGSAYKPEIILPGDMAHWSPIPDPESAGIGMSWITPAIREIQKDRIATTHTIRYFEQGATPNLVVKGITAANSTQFNEIVEMMEANHAGSANAYKTLYLTAGADATVIGSDLGAIDLKAVNGSAETRIASLSRVHPVILGIAEGLAGSSLNAGNFGMARRIWADSWIYPSLQDLAASLSPLINVPADAELWTDTGDMPILREDAKDAAEISQMQMSTAVAGVNGGWEPESVKAFIRSGNIDILKHSGMVSVQLQQPGADQGVDAGPKALPAGVRSAEPDDGLSEEEEALFIALEELAEESRAFDPSKHARNPKGSPGGGRFRSMVDRIKDALEAHTAGGGKGDPLKDFSREQLRRVAKAKGIQLSRGEGRDSIASKLLGDLGHKKPQAGAVNRKAVTGEEAIRAVPHMRLAHAPTGMRNGVSIDEIDGSLTAYKGAGYLGINEDLRKGDLNHPDTKDDIVAIDAGMGGLTADIEVYRGIRKAAKVFGDAWNDTDVTGLEWRDDAFVSTSADGRASNGFFSGGADSAIMKIFAPKGTKAVGISDYAEMEVLLSRGLTYRVVADHGLVNGRRSLDVEVVSG